MIGGCCSFVAMTAAGDQHSVSAPKPLRQHHFRPPPGSARLLLIRHGESEPVLAGVAVDLLDGQGDPGLAPLGEAQAQRVARRLRQVDLDAVYVSGFRRTVQSAAPLLADCAMSAVEVRELREVHLGEWEGGVYRQKVASGDALAVELFSRQRWDVIPGAERDEDFAERVQRALQKIGDAHADGTVAIFTHAGTIGQALSLATGSEPFAFIGADNGSISELVVWGKRWFVRRFNDTAHLEDLAELAPPSSGWPEQAARR